VVSKTILIEVIFPLQGVPDSGVGSSSEKTSTVSFPNLGYLDELALLC
jgi:hypothetical protein